MSRNVSYMIIGAIIALIIFLLYKVNRTIGLKTSKAGQNFIKHWEQLRLNEYLDQGGRPTIGWGHLIKKDETFQSPISEILAQQLFESDLYEAEKIVNAHLKVPVKIGLYDALVSHAYNTGTASQNIYALVNARASESVIKDYWQKHYITADGKPSAGVKNRRIKETQLF